MAPVTNAHGRRLRDVAVVATPSVGHAPRGGT